MSADRSYMVHFPWPSLVTVGAGGQGAYGTGIDTHAALFAVDMGQVVGRNFRSDVGRNHRRRAAILNTQREDVHAFATHAHATVAKDAPRTVEKPNRRPLLFVAMILGLGVEAVRRAVLERHVLQLA